MDGDGQLSAEVAPSVASVLTDDNLLREILLRLGFATSLVRAALVSKRWLLHASDKRFLCRFKERNPPHLLGFGVHPPGSSLVPLCNKFVVPLEQHPELAVLSSRVASSCDGAFAARRFQRLKHCQHGRLIIEFVEEYELYYYQLSLLLAEESVVNLPPIPRPHRRYREAERCFTEIFPPEGMARNGITLVRLWKVWQKVYAEVYVLGSGGWGNPTTAKEIELPHDVTILTEMLPPIRGKVFMVTIRRCVLGLDLATARFFILELPNGVKRNYMLSRAGDSGLYLVDANEFQLSVWLHQMTSNGDFVGGWLLMDTFCIHKACTHHVGDDWVTRGNIVEVVAVGDNADFILLDHVASGVFFYVHLKSRVVKKVHQRDGDGTRPRRATIPTVMVPWPPIFPPRNKRHDQEE